MKEFAKQCGGNFKNVDHLFWPWQYSADKTRAEKVLKRGAEKGAGDTAKQSTPVFEFFNDTSNAIIEMAYQMYSATRSDKHRFTAISTSLIVDVKDMIVFDYLDQTDRRSIRRGESFEMKQRPSDSKRFTSSHSFKLSGKRD